MNLGWIKIFFIVKNIFFYKSSHNEFSRENVGNELGIFRNFFSLVSFLWKECQIFINFKGVKKHRRRLLLTSFWIGLICVNAIILVEPLGGYFTASHVYVVHVTLSDTAELSWCRVTSGHVIHLRNKTSLPSYIDFISCDRELRLSSCGILLTIFMIILFFCFSFCVYSRWKIHSSHILWHLKFILICN